MERDVPMAQLGLGGDAGPGRLDRDKAPPQLCHADHEDLQDEYDEVAASIAVVERALSTTMKFKGDEARVAQLAHVVQLLVLANAAYTNFGVSLQSAAAMRAFGDRQGELGVRLKACTREYHALKGTTEQLSMPISGHETRDQTTGQLLHQGIAIQRVDIRSLERQLDIITNTKDAANETIAELARQEEQLLRIAGDASGVGHNLKQGARQVRLIARKLAGDNVIRCLCALMLLAILAAVLVIAVFPNTASSGVIFAQSNVTSRARATPKAAL